MLDMDAISAETLEVAKAVTNGIDSTTGIYGIDLSGLVSLIPVNTPARNRFARENGKGSQNAQWRALLNINNQQSNPAVGLDYAGPIVKFSEQNVFAPYVPFAEGVTITQDSMDLSMDYADVKAIGVLQAMNQLMIGEDVHIIGSQAYALPAIGNPSLTTHAAGGSILHTQTLDVKVAPRAGWNYFYGQSGPASSAVQATIAGSGDTQSVSATVAAVQGAVAYDWFAGAHGGTLYYVTTTVTNTYTFTSVPVANNTTVPDLPLISSTLPTSAPSTDHSYSENNYNGLLASTLGDYGSNAIVTPGAGVSSGAYWESLDGSTLTLSGAAILEIDAMLLGIWNQVQLSPTRLLMNAQQSQDIADKILGTNAAVTYLQPADEGGRAVVTAGGRLASYINKATGDVIPIEVHPHLPPGTIVAITERVPFPGANINNVFGVRTLRDYSQFDYGVSRVPNTAGGGPRQDSEVRLMSTFINRAPVACGVLSNIAPG